MKILFNNKFRNILIVISLPVQLILVQVISLYPLQVEQLYTQFFYRKLSYFLRLLFGNIPVPVGQILFYSLVTGLMVAIIRYFKQVICQKRNLKKVVQESLMGIVTFLSAFYFLFTVLWALNYYRQPVEEITLVESRQVTPAELEILCYRLIQLTNSTRSQVSLNQKQPLTVPITHQQMLAKATLGFAQVAQFFPELTYEYASVKSVYVPQVMSFFGVSGIYFPLTGEANVNMHPPAYLLPGTICHEMAHQIGFASEDEANYVAYLACRFNPDPSFQYSGNYMALKYAMNRLKKISPRRFKKLQKHFNPGLKQDLELNQQYWEQFQNPIEEFSDWFYDLFLKANDQKDGIQSYSRVVELLMGEYRKNQLSY